MLWGKIAVLFTRDTVVSLSLTLLVWAKSSEGFFLVAAFMVGLRFYFPRARGTNDLLSFERPISGPSIQIELELKAWINKNYFIEMCFKLPS